MTEIIDFINYHIKSLEKEVAELKADMEDCAASSKYYPNVPVRLTYF